VRSPREGCTWAVTAEAPPVVRDERLRAVQQDLGQGNAWLLSQEGGGWLWSESDVEWWGGHGATCESSPGWPVKEAVPVKRVARQVGECQAKKAKGCLIRAGNR
jgi:hypothetical protein